MADNDFFLKFGSNAKAFAQQLEQDLAPARKAVRKLQESLAELPGGSANPAFQQALAQSAGSASGGGERLHPLSVESLERAVRAQAQMTNDLVDEVGTVIKGLKAANEAISKIPETVRNARRGITQQENRRAEIDRGEGPRRNPLTGVIAQTGVQMGSLEDRIRQSLRTFDLAASAPRAVAPPAASIGSIRRSDIDRANFDRIIAAIHEQTAVLKSGLPVRGTGGGGGGGGGRAVASTGVAKTEAVADQLGEAIEEVGEEAEDGLRAAQRRLDALSADIEQMIRLLGGSADEASQQILRALQETRAEVAAETRKLERETTGISRTEQSQRAKAEFANRPTITDVERDRREQLAALIASPGAPDFDSRLSRARTAGGGNYSRDDLLAMREAFRSLGIRVDANTKATKEQLAAALRAAHAQYTRDYPEGHPDLQTSGFSVQKTTQVSAALTDLVGNLEGAAYEILEARNKIRADRRSGGTGERPTTRLIENVPGTIGTPSGFAGNWRGGVGAAVGAAEGLISPEELREAEQRVAASAERMRQRAGELISRGDFDPFALRSSQEVKAGQGDDQRALAEAATSALRDLRLATNELDELGRQAIQTANALAENEAFIERARKRIGTDSEKVGDHEFVAQERARLQDRLRNAGLSDADVQRAQEHRAHFADGGALTKEQASLMTRVEGLMFDFESVTRAAQERIRAGRAQAGDRERLAQAENEIRPRLQERMAGFDPTFLSEGYRAGLALRDASRAALEAAQVEQRRGELAMSDYRRLIQSTGQAVLGVTSAAGSRSVRRNIPGLGFSSRNEYVDLRDEGLGKTSPEEMEKINRGARALAAAQVRYSQTLADGDATEEQKNEATERLLRAADTLAARIARNFSGLAPSLETLTGIEPTGLANAGLEAQGVRTFAVPDDIRQAEAERQAARDRAAAEAARKFAPKTPQEELDLAQRTLRDTLAKRTQAEREAAQAAEVLERAEREHAQQLAALPDAQRNAAALAERYANREFRAVTRREELIPPPEPHEDPARNAVRRQQYLESGAIEENERRRLRNEQLRQSEVEARRRREEAERHVGDDPLLQQILELRRSAGRAATTLESLGSASDRAQANVDRLTKEIEDVQAAAARGLSRKAIAEETGVSSTRVRQILGPAEKKGKGKQGQEAQEADAIQRVTAAANGRIAALLDEQRAIRQSGEYRRKAAKEAYAAGRTEEYEAIRSRRARLAQIRGELKDLGYERGGGGAGSGGGDRGGRTGGDGPGGGGGRNNLLAQILATLQAIHATIKGGVKVTGGRTASQPTGGGAGSENRPRTGRSLAPTTEEMRLSRGNEAEILQAIQMQRAREERLRRSPASALERAHNEALEENERRQRAAGSAAERRNRELREQARAAEVLREATDRVSAGTRREIEELRRLSEAARRATTDEERLAAQKRIAAQQTRVAASLNRDLGTGANAFRAQDRKRLIQATLSDAGPKVNTSELDDIMRSVRGSSLNNIGPAGEQLGVDMGDAALDGFAKTFGGNTSFWSRIMHTTGTFIVRNFAAGFVFGLTNAMQEILTQALEAEATFIRVADALESTNKEVGSLRSELSSMSSEYGVALNDTYTTAASLTGLFDNTGDLAAATRISTQLQTISNGALNADEAVGVLASTLSAFGLDGVAGAERVADVLTSIQNNLGVNIETTAEGIASIAGLANQMNIAFEQAGVMVAAIAKQTNQTGAAAGEQFSRILAAMQTGRGRNAIDETFGPQVTTLINQGDYGDALTRMMSGWDDLTKSQQNNLATTLAGQRQMRAFQALMNDSTRNLRALDKAENSQGQAAARMEQIMRSLQNRVKQLGTTFQVLIDQLIQTGILNVLGAALLGLTSALRVVNAVLGQLNEFADASPLLGQLRDLAGFALGAVIAFKLLRVAIRGVKGAMGEMRETGNAWLQRENARRERLRGGPVPTPVPDVTPGAAPTARPGTRSAPRAGYILGGIGRLVQPSVGPGLAGMKEFQRNLQGSAQRLGRWAADFRPDGKISRPFHQLGSNVRSLGQTVGNQARVLQSRADVQMQRLEADRAMRGRGANIGRFGSMRAATLGGLDRAGQRALSATSKSLGAVGRTAQIAAAGSNRLANSLKNISVGALAADAALVVLTIGLARWQEESQRSSEQAQAARESARRLFPDSAGSWANSVAGRAKRATTEQSEYFGPAMEAWQAELDRVEAESESFWAEMGMGANLLLTNVREFITKTPRHQDFTSSTEYVERLSGVDSKTGLPYGEVEAQDIRHRVSAFGDLNPEGTQDIIELNMYREELRKQFEDLLKKGEADYTSGEISGTEYSSLLAQVERADKQAAEAIEDRKAFLKGLASGTALTVEQVRSLMDTTNLLQQIGTSTPGGLLGGAGNTGPTGSLDLNAILKERVDDLGLGDDSKLQKQFNRLLDPKRGPASSVDIAEFSVDTSAEAYRQADSDYRQAVEDNAPDDAVEDAKQARDQALQQYLDSLNGLIDTIRSSANTTAGFQSAAGDFRGAMRTQINAIDKIDGIFERQNKALLAPLRAAERLLQRVRRRARELQQGIGGAYNPDSDLDVMARQYNDPSSKIKDRIDGNVRRLRRLLHGTAQWQQHAANQIADVHAYIQTAIAKATADFSIRIAKASTDALKRDLEAQRDAIIAGIWEAANNGELLPGMEDMLPGERAKAGRVLKKWGDYAVDDSEANEARANAITSQREADEAAADEAKQRAEDAKQRAAEARQNAAALRQAQLGVRQAAAEARGDSVAAARVQVAMAQAMIAAAKADLAAATTQSESAQARIAILNAQAQLIGAHAQVQQAQQELVQSQYDVSIALAEAAGKTVLVASRQLGAARAALAAARRRSGGKATAEVNQARAEAIRAEAALRDARLQDDLDTIDFNLEMGKITQSSAIAALQQILKTRDLTRDQRRQLMLQIKGMKDEMADSQWNIGDIRMPTPYQMRRYIAERRAQFRSELDQAAGARPAGSTFAPMAGSTTTNQTSVSNNTFVINGADTAKVKKIITEVVGGSGNTRTVAARRH